MGQIYPDIKGRKSKNSNLPSVPIIRGPAVIDRCRSCLHKPVYLTKHSLLNPFFRVILVGSPTLCNPAPFFLPFFSTFHSKWSPWENRTKRNETSDDEAGTNPVRKLLFSPTCSLFPNHFFFTQNKPTKQCSLSIHIPDSQKTGYSRWRYVLLFLCTTERGARPRWRGRGEMGGMHWMSISDFWFAYSY